MQFSSRNEHCNSNDELNQLSYRHFAVLVNWIEFNCWRNVSENIGFIASKDNSLNIGREIRRKHQSGKNYRKTKFHESTMKKKAEREKSHQCLQFHPHDLPSFSTLEFSEDINWTNAECHLYFSYQMFAGKHSIRWNSPFDHFSDGNISSKKTLRKISEIFFMHQSLFRWSEHVKIEGEYWRIIDFIFLKNSCNNRFNSISSFFTDVVCPMK